MNNRVTQSMLSNLTLRNLHSNMIRMNKWEEQLSTTRRINRPSDDPVGISYSMRYRSELGANEQYKANVGAALSWLENTDTTLGQVGDLFHKVRVLTVQAANGTNSTEALQSIKSEFIQLREQLISISNTHFNGKYVFNGQMTDLKPYDPDNPLTNTDDGIIEFEIGVGVKIAVNVTGNQVFGSATADDNAFKVMDDLIIAIDGESSKEISDILARIDTRFDKMLQARTDAGAKTNRLELAEERLLDIGVNLKTLQSKTEDADMAEVITQLKMAENVYQASLSVTAMVIRPSLIDFIR